LAGEYKPKPETNRILNDFFLLKVLFFFPGLLIYISSVSGQTLREFKEIWVSESREYLLNNQKPLPYLQSGFYYFSRLQDNVLTEGLEAEWEKFPVSTGTPVPKSIKFDPAPKFNFEETSNHNPQFWPFYTAEKSDEDYSNSSANLPRIRKPEYISSNPIKMSFKFYGNAIAVTYDKLLSLPVAQPISAEVVLGFWKKFLVANSHHLVSQLMTYRDRLGLNDWGYFLLVKSCSNSLYPNDESGATILSWALMVRSGYDVKIGFNQLGCSILYRTSSKINGVPTVRINGTEYYVDNIISSFPITSFGANHPGATGLLHLNIDHSLNFQGEVINKKIQFPWDKKLYEFNLKYNPEVIRFLEAYPQTDPELYDEAPFSFLAKESLLKQFRPILAGMNKEEGAAFLQQFVQKTFAYRPYNDMYGHDRFMFPEELLFKSEGNDKGKSLLYAWMISNLLNQRAALIEFPGFYSVAISLDKPMDGDNFLINGRSYTIADPTFENAPIGLIMKEFYSVKPIITPLNYFTDNENQEAKIWKLATAFGAERSGTGTDFLKDESGNSYITGFFDEKSSNNSPSTPTPFIAKFDENYALVWMVKFRSDCKAFGLELKQLDRNEFYLAGSFRGELECDGNKIQSDPSDPDLFFAQFDRQGKIGWMVKSGLDDLEEETRLFYIVRFTRSGDIQSVQLANEDERTGITGFRQSTNEGLCYVASRYQTTGLDKSSEEAILNPSIRFRQNLNRMKQLGIDLTMAGLASLFNSVKNSGDQLTGVELASLIPEKMETGNITFPKLIETIQKIKLIKNYDGIVETYTVDGKPLKISSFRITSRSHLKIIPLDNNDLKIKVIDGIEYESGAINEPVNSLIIDRSTGNLIVDLGAGHLTVSKNLRRESPK
jgi:hypothetical protein